MPDQTLLIEGVRMPRFLSADVNTPCASPARAA
jgi:hypothetical protein